MVSLRLKSKPFRMRKVLHLAAVLILGLMAPLQLSAQCIPDTINCADTTGTPGAFCPQDLPDAGLNVLYDETVTVIPPGSYLFYGNVLTIFHIRIDSVLNLPPGIDYFPNADTLFPDTAYCIQLTGTPTQTGVFDLAIYITATVDFGGPLEAQVVDDTSISITVLEELGTGPDHLTEFRVIPNVPNPFSERTRLAFYTPKQHRVELYVYNILGSLVHHEWELASPGTHSFRFDGSELKPGTYLYRVATPELYHTGKLMKTR